jgi:hypothetical protein
MFSDCSWMPLASLPPCPNTSRSKIVRMITSPISAVPRIFTDSSTSK